MVKSVTPIAGFDPEAVHSASSTFKPPHSVGTTITADDGHDYAYAMATGAIGANVSCALTEPAFTMAAGAGDWTSPATALAVNDYAWFKKTDI